MTNTATNLSRAPGETSEISLCLQDAFFYAARAANTDAGEHFYAITRSEALRLAKSAARKAGYTVHDVRKLSDAKDLLRQISAYAAFLRIDPYTGTHLGTVEPAPASASAPKLTIEEAKHHLDHGTDGPLSAFVLISRAAELAGKGSDPETVANALHECLTEFSFLRTDATPIYFGEV